MNVYVTGTPEVSKQLIKKVVQLLGETKGPINPSQIDLLRSKDLEPDVNLDQKEIPITFDSLNKVAEKGRSASNYDSGDFYVILTSHKLDLAFFGKNWFSYFNKKNVFVRTYGWEEHTPGKIHIAIAHQIIENIFQSLSGYNFERYDYYHDRAKGCINDFCKNEYEIEFKLRAGHICKSCLDVAVNNGTSIEQIDQISRFLNLFRDELLDFKSVIQEMDIPQMTITEKGKVVLGDKIVMLDYIHLTFYIFTILHRGKEISVQYLRSHIDQFRNIYFALKKTGSDKAVQTFMGYSVDEVGNQTTIRELDQMKKYVKDKRSEIKKSIEEVAGNELAELFKIGSFSTIDHHNTKHFYSIMPENSRVKIEIEKGLMELIE